MSAVVETPEVETDEPNVISDGSSIIDPEKLTAVLANVGAVLLASVRAESKALVSKVKVAAYQYQCRAHILYNGFPDWAGKSQTYRDEIATRETPVYDKAGWTRTEVNRFRTAVRVAGMRAGWLERAIVDYVMAATPENTHPTKWTAEGANGAPALPAESGDVFAASVRAQYDAAGIPAPAKYGGTSEKAAKTGNRAAPVASMGDLAKDVEKFSPLVVVGGLKDVSIALARSLSTGDIAERGKVVQGLLAVAEVLALTAKNADGKASPAEVATLGRIIAVDQDVPVEQ